MTFFWDKQSNLGRAKAAIIVAALAMLPICHAYSAAKFRASSDPVKFARMAVRTHQVTPVFVMCYRSFAENGNASSPPCLEARASLAEFAEAFSIIPLRPDDVETFKATITAVVEASERR